MTDDFHGADVLVVGGGQAGLAMAYYLQRAGLSFAVLDKNARVGAVWESRWDSLRLFTPARYSQLPGMSQDLDPWTYPGKDDVAAYLDRYAKAFDLPIRLGWAVTSLRLRDAEFVLGTDRGSLVAHQVVIATGPFQVPVVPALSQRIDSGVTQLHSCEYRRPDQLPEEGELLVVGGGNSGYQIALELATSGRRVHLARGTNNVSVPQRPLGRDIFWWQQLLGIMNVRSDSKIGRRMRANDGTIIGISAQDLGDAGVTLHDRVVDAVGRTIRLRNGDEVDVSAVVWATGFRQDHSWIDVAGALDADGRPVHHRGVSPVKGLYVLGLPWLHTTGSALLGFVGRDAEYLASVITSNR